MKITQRMLNAAMKKAVALKVIPKYSDQDTYLKYWEGMKKVLEIAINEIKEDDCPVCGKKLDYIDGWYTCHDCENK